MLTFRDYIQEALDTPYPWEWVGYEYPPDEKWSAEFVTPNITIRVDFEKAESWWMTFYPTAESMKAHGIPLLSKYDITGTGNARQILSTTIDILKDFINKEHPPDIKFSSSGQPKLGKTGVYRPDGRTRLYQRLTALASQMLPGYSQLSPNQTNTGVPNIFGIKKDGVTGR